MIEPTYTPEERRRTLARGLRFAKRAETLAENGRIEEAIGCQSQAVALRPDDPVGFFRLGMLHREAHHPHEAVSPLRRAIALDPEHRDLREALLGTLLEAGRYAEMVPEGRDLIKLVPRSLFAREVLSIAYLQLGQVGKALQATAEMIRLDPLNPGHHVKRALLFQQQGNLSGAMAEFARVQETAEEDSELFEDACEALEALDDYQTRQILLLASEDRVFGMKLRRDTAAAVRERGFHLSQEGLGRLRHLAVDHLAEMTPEYSPSATWGGVRSYH